MIHLNLFVFAGISLGFFFLGILVSALLASAKNADTEIENILLSQTVVQQDKEIKELENKIKQGNHKKLLNLPSK